MRVAKVIKKSIKITVRFFAKRSPAIDRYFRGVLAWRKNRQFNHIIQSAKINNKAVVFMSFMGRSYSDSPKELYKAMLNNPQYSNWTLIWALRPTPLRRFKGAQKSVNDNIKYFADSIKQLQKLGLSEYRRAKAVRYGSRKYLEALASSKYWITNSHIMDGIHPTEKHVLLQTWHGTPIKRLGADISVDKANPMRSNQQLSNWYKEKARDWSYILAQNSYGADKMISSFSLGEVNKDKAVITEGYPRNDFLINFSEIDAERIKTILGIPSDKKVALYAPTFRDDQHSAKDGYVYQVGCDFNKLREKLGKGWVILFRAHYFVSGQFDNSEHNGFVIDVSRYDDINELFIISDVLITDYSSIVFDYSTLCRPIILYTYDYEHYKNDVRGFYLPLSELPGTMATNEEELAAILNNFYEYRKMFAPKIRNFNRKYDSHADGNVSQRVLNNIISKEDLR
jgi:CDP-glycerol glycerophosphotransferase